ncbi:MAG: Lpg1974 family pore-forming outer membrane protein [Pirellulales bacterium]
MSREPRTGAVQARFDRNPVTRWAAAQDGAPMASGTTAAPPQTMRTESIPAGPMSEAFDAEYLPYAQSEGMLSAGTCSSCGSAAPCDACNAPYSRRRWSRWNAGFAAAFVEPRSSDNAALTVSDSGTSSATATETSFDYDMELSPRLWLEWRTAESWGGRIQWWQLDQDANQVLAEAPASGLGLVTPAEFADIDISVSLPGETLRADSHVKLYAIDFEGMRHVDFDCWSLLAAGGLRYASIEQEYRADATNTAGAQSGAIEEHRSLEGIGPTFLLEVRRPLTPRVSVFSNARASLLFGDGETTLTAGEDLDLASSFTTTRSSANDDLLPILETQWGVDWRTSVTPCHDFFLTAALEGQWWSGVGSASNDDADLGLFGFAFGLGLQY